MYIGCFLFNLTPFINNMLSGAFQGNTYSAENNTAPAFKYPVYLYLPFTIQNNIQYGLISIFNVLFSYDVASIFCTFDVLMSVIIFHVWGHLKILKYHLENFPKPALAVCEQGNSYTNVIMYTEEESQNIFEILKENIEHHKLIIK